MKKMIYGLVGATASGKTGASIALCHALQGEVVCMDSMQIYRGMDIGTAKPTLAEQDGIPHHMLDVAEPTEAFSVTEYARMAHAAIQSIQTPVLVGGTGLYLQALSLPLDFGFTKGDDTVRAVYQKIADEQSNEALHALLDARDPPTAARLHPNDVRRVIRALEVYDLTGRPFSAQVMPSSEDAPYDFRLFALDMPRDILYQRIDQRVLTMLKDGLLDEVKALLDNGVPENAQAMQGLGYKELVPVLKGESTLKDATAYLQQRTRNYAKRQLIWFRRDTRIIWLPWDSKNLLEQMILSGENQ